MGFLAVIVAGAAAWIFGAVWYMALAKPWMAAAGVSEADVNRSNPVPYVLSLVCVVIVAGMMRHVFASSGVETVGGGFLGGLGLGLFIAVPWLTTNYAFAGRPMALTLIDGGYAAIGSTLIGVVLTLF